MKEKRTLGFYEVIQKTLRKYKGCQLNYDSAIEGIAVEVTREVLTVFEKNVRHIFDEIRKDFGINDDGIKCTKWVSPRDPGDENGKDKKRS